MPYFNKVCAHYINKTLSAAKISIKILTEKKNIFFSILHFQIIIITSIMCYTKVIKNHKSFALFLCAIRNSNNAKKNENERQNSHQIHPYFFVYFIRIKRNIFSQRQP